MDNIKTGNLIKELRKGKGMTQKDLADKLHITDRAVSKWEREMPFTFLCVKVESAKLCSVMWHTVEVLNFWSRRAVDISFRMERIG